MEATRGRGTAVLLLVVAGVVLASAAAVLLDVPTAAVVLAVLCLVLAVVRGTDRSTPPVFRARSKPFDVAALLVVAAALAVLAPAGNLT